jgi:ribonuclease HI
MVPKPHFLLFCDGNSPKVSASRESVSAVAGSASVKGRWRFVLEDLDAGTRLEACDAELVQAPERAALLAVVRGLEALEQPSRVTLVTTSRYVSRGLQFGLIEWRESDYCWEHFGSVQPIRNADLWRRIDHAMQFHQIKCQWIAGHSTEDSEEMTHLEIEPIKTSPSFVAPTPAANVAGEEQRQWKMPLVDHDENVHAAEKIDGNWARGWGRWVRLMWSAPIRSLRLPPASSFFTNVVRHGWIGKLSAWITWFSRHSRTRRLAV